VAKAATKKAAAHAKKAASLIYEWYLSKEYTDASKYGILNKYKMNDVEYAEVINTEGIERSVPFSNLSKKPEVLPTYEV
jgi:hypothetical protein